MRKSDVFEVDLDYQPFFETEDDNFPDNRSTGLLSKGTFVGTPLYVSPEMLEHSIAHYSSDLWSVGCIIYQCLLGYPPFKGTTENIVFEQILEC